MNRTYSKRLHGNVKVTDSLIVNDFACHDGSDFVIIDANLTARLNGIKKINSAYRNDSYNRRIGGVAYSEHTKGHAVDIPKGSTTLKHLRDMGLFVIDEGSWYHADTRFIRPTNVTPVLKKGNKGEWVNYLQYQLTRKGFKTIADQNFGKTTKANVMAFQRANKLYVDGIVGNKTWSKLEA